MSEPRTAESIDSIFAKLTDHLDWTRAEGRKAVLALRDPAGLHELVRRLAHHAAFGCEEYQSHFGMVDAYRTECQDAADALVEIFTAHGFGAEDAVLIRDAAHHEHASDTCIRDLLYYLERWTQPLLEEMATSASARVRLRAVLACEHGKRLDPVRFLDDPDPRVRRAAVDALPDAGASHRRAALLANTRHDDPDTRARAIHAIWGSANTLANPRDAEPLEPLIALLDDPDRVVRLTAVRELARWQLAPLANRLATEPDPLVRAEIVAMLQPPFIAPLVRALADSDPRVRRLAANGLRNVDDETVARAIRERLAAESVPDVRAALERYAHGAKDPPDATPRA